MRDLCFPNVGGVLKAEYGRVAYVTFWKKNEHADTDGGPKMPQMVLMPMIKAAIYTVSLIQFPFRRDVRILRKEGMRD